MATSQEYTISRKVSDTEEEIIQIPYDALANKPDLSVYQTKNDASLATTDKTVVGAINEVNSTAGTNKTNITNIKNGTAHVGVAKKVEWVFHLSKWDGKFTGTKDYDGSKAMRLGFNTASYFELGENASGLVNGYVVELKDTGVTAGTYNNVTVDSKGRVTSGESKDYALKRDIPAKVTSVDGLDGGTISGNVSTTGNLTVGGNFTVNGTTTTVDSTTLQVKDKLIEVAHGNTTALTTPAGLVAPKYDGTNSGALVFDSTGTAYVGDVTLKDGNIDVANSGLQPLATRTGLVGGNLVQYDSSALTLKDSGKKISDLALKTDIPNSAKHGSTLLATNTDLNTLNSSADIGWYHVGGGNRCAHKPSGVDAFGLEVGRSAVGWFYQVLTSANASTSRGRRFMRTYSGTEWYGWTKVAITSDIPAVNNGTLTIQKNGTTVQTFTANQSSSVTANITVPTKVSELTNDSGFITSAPANYTTSSLTPSQCTANGFYYVISSTNSLTDANGNPFLQYHTSNNDFRILATAYSDSWVQQIATDFRSTHIYYRIRNNGTWGAWTEIAKISDIPNISGKLDKTKYEVNKTIDFGSSGVLYVGKFKVYDTNVTCEVTSTTNVTYSGKLVIATQNYVISEAKVYGDATNTVAPNFFIKPSTTSDPYIEVYFKPSSWSKNVVHIYGSNIQAEPTDVCTNVPSVPSKATLKPKNALTFELSGTTLTITL